MSFSGCSVGLSLFQGSLTGLGFLWCLASLCFSQATSGPGPLLGSSAGLTVSLSNPYCLRGHGDRGTSKCGQFQGFSEALLNCVLSELKEFPPQAGEFHLPLEQNPAVSPPCKHSF